MPLLNIRDRFGPRERRPLPVGEKRRFPPCVQRVEALLGLARGTSVLGVHVDAKGAAVQLRGAGFYQFQQRVLQPTLPHGALQLCHGLVAFGKRLQIVESLLHWFLHIENLSFRDLPFWMLQSDVCFQNVRADSQPVESGTFKRMSAVIHSFDVIVLGAGAAGLMCAIEAGRCGRRVAVLDHAERPGKKILISGGGRCNFTNIHCRAENFLSQNPHFAKSALARYTPADFLALVERHGIAWHEKTLGQLFCNGSARQILDLLLEECAAANVRIFLRTSVHTIAQNTGFRLIAGEGSALAEFRAPVLIVATGGLSIPQMGATGFGYSIAHQFGLPVVEPRPALVPLVFNSVDQRRWCDLAGVSAEVIASANGARFQEKMLVTHRGLSGPAILQISSYWHEGEAVTLDFAPGSKLTAPLLMHPQRDTNRVRAALREKLSQRLADRILALQSPSGFSNRALEAWEQSLHAWEFIPAGTEGFAKAEVTAGGVDTACLSAKTMESRVPGLFFIGEAVDVTGHLGGFNFQWAWASGAAAGRAV